MRFLKWLNRNKPSDQRQKFEDTDEGKEFIEKLERNFNNLQHDGYIRLFDYDLGGKENGKWTSWTCEKMATMLDKENLNYKIGKDAECINL